MNEQEALNRLKNADRLPQQHRALAQAFGALGDQIMRLPGGPQRERAIQRLAVAFDAVAQMGGPQPQRRPEPTRPPQPARPQPQPARPQQQPGRPQRPQDRAQQPRPPQQQAPPQPPRPVPPRPPQPPRPAQQPQRPPRR